MKHLLTFFIALGITALASTSALAQMTNSCIEIQVVDEDTSEPIIFATVAFFQNGIRKASADTDLDGKLYFCKLDPSKYEMEVSYIGYQTRRQKVAIRQDSIVSLLVKLSTENVHLDEIVVIEYSQPNSGTPTKSISGLIASSAGRVSNSISSIYNHESYAPIKGNSYQDPQKSPLSTFSLDVDKAAYSNVRRFISNGDQPPRDAVRIEEMINYFPYDYPTPQRSDNTPIAVHHTYTECPWQKEHKLLHIGLKGEEISKEDLPASNFVFLVDVSGSMSSHNKLPLIKKSLKLLVNQLRSIDKVAIVTYAGSSDLLLPPTSGEDKTTINKAIANLQSSGSTNGAQGIITAYELAQQQHVKKGNNRVILMTDGDFNVGQSSDKQMEDLISKYRSSGIYLSVLGYGMGNYKDSKMQALAQSGNGNHAYIDNLLEARKTLVTELGGTLYTIAKDVKIQIEFNPEHVSHYKLIGYENRLLEDHEFNDDKADAGELGEGHTMTAIYEIIPAGVMSPVMPSVDSLKYQNSARQKRKSTHIDELATIKLRWKKPNQSRSKKKVYSVSAIPMPLSEASDDLRFGIAVAEFGLILRKDIDHSLQDVISRASNARSRDEHGYRAEFIRLIETYQELEFTD